MVVDWILTEVASQGKTGIQWTLTTQLHDLDYAESATYVHQDQTPCRENRPQGQQRKDQSYES